MDEDKDTTKSTRGITVSAVLLALVISAGAGYWFFFRQPDKVAKDSASVAIELADPLTAGLDPELPALIDPSERTPAIDDQAAISETEQISDNEIEEAETDTDEIVTTSIGTLAPALDTDDSFLAQGSQQNEVGPGRLTSTPEVRGIIADAALDGSIEGTMKVSPTAQTGPGQLAWVLSLAMAALGAAGLARLHLRSHT